MEFTWKYTYTSGEAESVCQKEEEEEEEEEKKELIEEETQEEFSIAWIQTYSRRSSTESVHVLPLFTPQ